MNVEELKIHAAKIATVLLSGGMLVACGQEATAPEIQMQVADGYIQYFNGADWENLIAVEDLRGPQGEPGQDGKDGKDGKDGADGIDGKDGATGAQGPAGAKGETGATGPAGQDGVNGANGRDGRDGSDGSGAVPCNHVYRQVSQVVNTLESYEDGSSLLRRTYTLICDKCGTQTIMYYDFDKPALTSPSSPTSEVTPTPETTPTSAPDPTPGPTATLPSPSPIPSPSPSPTPSVNENNC